MHYHFNAADWHNNDELPGLVLALWYHRDPEFFPPIKLNKDNSKFVYPNKKPSDRDVEGIQKP
jgi:hypothetical protein